MADRIRVLLIAPSLEILGGQSVQATRLLSGLSREPEIAAGFQPINPPFPKPFAWMKRVPYLRTALMFLLYCTQLLARAWRYDILHIFSAGLYSYRLWTIPALLIARLYGKKSILNYRDGRVEEHLREWRTALPTARLADVIVSPSEYVASVFGRYGIAAKAIFNVIDLGCFRYRQRGKLRPVFMTNRILEPLYNVGCVLRAFAVVQQRYPEASLTVAHDGLSRQELEGLARELKLANTRFVGRVPHAEAPDLYDSADVYLTSPNFDCMPGSLLECYASGVPIVATRTGGIPYIVRDGETGLLVECNDHEAMAACSLRLLEDAELVERLTRQGFQELDKYDWNRGGIRENWLAVYRSLVPR